MDGTGLYRNGTSAYRASPEEAVAPTQDSDLYYVGEERGDSADEFLRSSATPSGSNLSYSATTSSSSADGRPPPRGENGVGSGREDDDDRDGFVDAPEATSAEREEEDLARGQVLDFIDTYLSGCEEAGVAPRTYVVEKMQALHDAGYIVDSVDLCGSQNEMFNDRLADDEMPVICRALGAAPVMTTLDFSLNALTDACIPPLAEYLKYNTNVRTLDLSHNGITHVGMIELCAALGSSLVTALSVEGNPVGDEGVRALYNVLSTVDASGVPTSALVAINLADVGMTTSGLIRLAAVVGSSTSKLTYLDISAPVLFSYQEETVVHIGKALRVNPSLVELSLSKHRMGDYGVSTLVGFLKSNKTLETLRLAANKITQPGGVAIASLLAVSPSLMDLDLRGNMIDDEGAVAVAEALAEHNYALTRLDVSHNNIHARGLSALAVMLSINNSLSALAVWGNHFDAEAAADFFDILSAGDRPTEIDIEPYVVDGVASVARADMDALTIV